MKNLFLRGVISKHILGGCISVGTKSAGVIDFDLHIGLQWEGWQKIICVKLLAPKNYYSRFNVTVIGVSFFVMGWRPEMLRKRFCKPVEFSDRMVSVREGLMFSIWVYNHYNRTKDGLLRHRGDFYKNMKPQTYQSVFAEFEKGIKSPYGRKQCKSCKHILPAAYFDQHNGQLSETCYIC